jgi:hypothetical protein
MIQGTKQKHEPLTELKNNLYLYPPTKGGTNFTSYQSSAYSARQICNKFLENLVVA